MKDENRMIEVGFWGCVFIVVGNWGRGSRENRVVRRE